MAQEGFYPLSPAAGSVLQADATSTVEQAYVAHYHADDVAAPSATAVMAAVALAAATQTITTGITSPVCPRNVTVKGNAGGMAGAVVITGTDMADEVLTESIALNATTEVAGLKAFKTVTQVELPVLTNAVTDTVSVGIGELLGLPYKLTHNTVIATYLNNVLEGTAPTVATSTTVLASNTADLNSANNATDVDIYLLI